MQKIFLLTTIAFLFQLSLYAQQGDILKSEAIMYEGLENYEKAAVTYEKAAAAYESENTLDTLSIYKAGQCYSRSKQFANAIPFLTRCIELNYPEPGVYSALSNAYEGLKDKEKAEATLEEGITKFPEAKTEYTKKLGYLYFNSGKYDKAVTCLETALESDPNNETFLYLYGSSLDKLKKYNGAAAAFEKVLVSNPNHKKSITKLGLVYYKQVDYKYKKEKKRYEAIKSPSRVDYHNYTQKVAAISQEYKKALPMLEKALELSPKNKAIISCLSVSYKRLKMKDKEAAMNTLLQK
jgi:tetratricopeptide (TPR) repeat protein